MGSDGYVWVRVFISKNAVLSGELENKKHLYREIMWGRLAYNPNLDKLFFLKTLASRFSEIDVDQLYTV